MAHFITEEEMIRSRAIWYMDQLDMDDQEYCRKEAEKLDAMGLTDEDGKPISYHSWLDTVAGSVYRNIVANHAAMCGEIGED